MLTPERQVNSDALCTQKVYQAVLYIVATPIGHLADISLRAIEILKKVDCIFAEDTRHAKKCLLHYQIKTPCLSLHEHNEKNRVALVKEKLSSGLSVALISDAGTPLISDPGYVLVRELKAEGYQVSPVPGACAAIAALSVSGLPTDRFLFEGFLPAKSVARCKQLALLASETSTLVFYESCHRIVDSLQDMVNMLGSTRLGFIGRELTKSFEETISGSLSELFSVYQGRSTIKGELVVVIAGCKPLSEVVEQEMTGQEVCLLTNLQSKLPPKEVASIAHAVFSQKKKHYYDWLLNHKKSED